MAKIKIERGLNLGMPYTPDMQDGGKRPEPTWSGIRDQVREADALVYDTILAVETQHDPYLELAVAAQEPSKIELATGIALAYTKSPVATAYTAWDLQRMSGGRLNLGLGSQVKGHVTRRFGMPWSKPAQRMKDYVGAMRACWRTWQTREPFNFQSEHYNLSLMTPNFAPPPVSNPHIPVLIAAVEERMLQVAGEVCDGVRLHGIVTRKYLDQIAFPNLKKGFEKSGRPVDEWNNFQIGGGGFLCAAKDKDSLARAVSGMKSTIAFYGSTPSFLLFFQIDGRACTPAPLSKLSVHKQWPQLANAPNCPMRRALAAVPTH